MAKKSGRAENFLGDVRAIEETVLEELEELTAAAEGEIPEAVTAEMEGNGGISCETRLALRLRNRLHDDVHRAQELFRLEKDHQFAEDLMESWEIWLELHGAASRLHRMLGTNELATLWYGGLRDVAWNNASRIFNSSGKRTAWISIIMFHWVATTSQLLGDEEGMTVNRNNMKICGYAPPNKFLSRLLRMTSHLRSYVRAESS